MIIIKTEKEIEIMRAGGKILAHILKKLTQSVKPGVATGDLEAMANDLIRRAGGRPSFKGYKSTRESKAFPTALCTSINEEVVHAPALPSRILKEGDIVGIDVGMEYPYSREGGGYFTDMAVTVGVGKISRQAEKLIKVTKKSLILAIKKVKPRNTHKAIGDQAKAVLIDHGLLRKNEAAECVHVLQDGLGVNIHLEDESDKFLQKLAGVTDPEEKRKIIGNQFIYSFESVASKFGDMEYLAQGTLYPDVIESGVSRGNAAHVIKSHHNVGGLPDDMEFELIEPLRKLFKDEVRDVGKELGLPDKLINRHPFPGPGLGVRIIGEITRERVAILQEADDIYIKLLHEEGLYDEIWQAFAILIPVQTVGVMGDQRTYENLLGLRAVTSTDGMTADWYRMPPEVLSKISNKIVNSVKGINRVTYDVTSKPPGTIEWE